jgi:hypothetical protein
VSEDRISSHSFVTLVGIDYSTGKVLTIVSELAADSTLRAYATAALGFVHSVESRGANG